ncbi:MAG: hypothetical protein IPL95_20055 [Saprospiraceae bacterium]|nr:hypothetical protein [Saprospiraceae bacterium]
MGRVEMEKIFWNISHWKEVGDTANIITVYLFFLGILYYRNEWNIENDKWNASGSFGYCLSSAKDDGASSQL